MKIRPGTVPAVLLTIIFIGHSLVLAALEPAMGFRNVADFFDLDKVMPALESAAWFASNTLHVATGATLLFFQSGIRSLPGQFSTAAANFCFAAAPLFVITGMAGFVGDQLLWILESNPAGRDASLYGLLAARMMVLAAAVALFGMMILAISLDRNLVATWLRVPGVPIGLAAVLFLLVPTPVPLLFLVWLIAFSFGRRDSGTD